MSRIQIAKLDPVVREAKYSYIPLTYTDKGKTFTRKIVSFASVYDTISKASVGDFFEIELKKNANGNWEWVNATKVEEGSPTTAAGSTGKSGNWETSEERARRQILIVRQSCLAQAIAYHNDSDVEPTTEDILKTAVEFEQWVNRE